MIIDTNVTLSRWPLRRVHGDEPAELVAMLRLHRVEQAWASSFDALLHKDIAAVNARLAEDCGRYGKGLLVPFGAVNPNLPDWEDDLRRCHEEHRMPGLRLYPGYHGYTLGEPSFARLLGMAAERGLVVQVAARMHDPRTQHRLFAAPTVDLRPLAEVAPKIRNLRLVVLNASGTPEGGGGGDQLGGAAFDIATVEGVGGVAQMIEGLGAERVVFGSHAPLFHFESAMLKMRESELMDAQAAAVLHGNARRILGQQD